MENITFAVIGSNSLHKLELSKTLIRFSEFDFTYFWEQCIEAGRNARKTGRISQKIEEMALNAAAKCHPYVEACISTEFSSLVLDCIIAYICHSEGIGLEDLWARCITPKSLYEKDIFNRVSEYKTGRGINQWINLVRLQEYARSKIKFIYETDSNVMVDRAQYRTRREYFDLAFSVAANETGCPMKEMPSVRKYSPAQLPDSVFMIGRVSKHIYRRLADVLSESEMWSPIKLNDHNRDSTALDAFSYVKDMPRPGEMDMRAAVEAFSELPEMVYVPDSFKACIDLEFTCMFEEGIYLSKCPRCGKYFVRGLDETSPYCNRVNATGRTCTELVESEFGIVSDKKEDKKVHTEETVTEQEAANENYATEELVQESPVAEEKEIPAEEPKKEPVEIPKELERRCQRAYNTLYKRIGKIMTSFEFKEWSKYLYDMKRDIREGEADMEQLESFLSYWETAVRKQSKKLRNKDPYHEAEEMLEKEYAAQTEAVTVKMPETVEEEPVHDIRENEKSAADKEETGSGIAPAGTERTPDGRVFRPFTPPKYNTVLEAMLDGKYKSEELLNESTEDDDGDIKVRGKKVTLPQWERISRD